MSSHIVSGTKVWVRDDEEAYLLGTVKTASQTQLEVVTEKGQVIRRSPRDADIEICGSHVDNDMENLVDLDEFSEGAILHHVRKRFRKKAIYTHVGAILVAVNPFEMLDIYGQDDMQRAQNGVTTAPFPHVFHTAATAYLQLVLHQKPQSVLISGESGAGKTETTKKVLQYLANVAPGGRAAPGEPGLEEKILRSNPLLEAMGNAKTLRNNNSSRFGKYMKVDFDAGCRIQGCEIVNYLLEKSRVVVQTKGERNYHIFYQLIAGAKLFTSEERKALGLLQPSEYRYLRQSGCESIAGVDDAHDFAEVRSAMDVLQIPPEVQRQMFQVLAAVLLLGNISFVNDASGYSAVDGTSRDLLAQVAALVGVKAGPDGGGGAHVVNLQTSLVERHMIINKELTPVRYNKQQADDNRDAVAKALYSKLFDWTIKHVNSTLRTEGAPLCIGVLDIFGFEVFDVNSFEQLCINYANEKLQFHFNEVVFKQEMQMYEDEGLSTENIKFEDNLECVALIEVKPTGLLCLLDSECKMGEKSTDITYVAKLNQKFPTPEPFKGKLGGKNLCFPFLAKGSAGCSNARCALLHAKDIGDVFSSATNQDRDTWKAAESYARVYYSDSSQNAYYIQHKQEPSCFSVKHFAGSVKYTTTNWLDKNRDNISTTVREALQSSSIPLVAALFDDDEARGVKLTLGGHFRDQLIGLLDSLKKTDPHFVRCVKPNHEKKGGIFDGHLVLQQLRYAGLFEAIRIRKSGYAYRATHKVFANQYLLLVDGLLSERARMLDRFNYRDACIRIIKQAEHDKILLPLVALVGLTRIFIKDNVQRSDLEVFKRTRQTEYAIRIQAVGRGYIARLRTHGARMKLEQAKERARQLEARKEITIIVIQKHVRRFLVQRLMVHMDSLIKLRKALHPKDSPKPAEILKRIRDIVAGIEATPLQGDNRLRAMFSQEVAIARTMMKLIEIQETFRRDMEHAIEECDVVELNRLLVRAERLELGRDPIVERGREELRNLHRRRFVYKNMVAFLKNENEYDKDPAEMLKEATSVGVDQAFISKVRRVYDGAGPRLNARSRLRQAIETVEKRKIESGLEEIETLQRFHVGFADAEQRAGRLMLRLLNFESQLCPRDHLTRMRHSMVRGGGGGGGGGGFDDDGDDGLPDGEDDGPKLSGEMIQLCDDICSTPRLDAARAAKRSLQQLCGGSAGLEEAVRCYKWSKLLCTWKYPEVRAASGQSSSEASSQGAGQSQGLGLGIAGVRPDEFEFFGLRASDARSSVFLIRMLHGAVSTTLGEAPPSMQAALGSLELPASVRDTMDKLDRGVAAEEAQRQKLLQQQLAATGNGGVGGKGGKKLSDVSLRRLQQAALTPKKQKVQLSNLKPKKLHEYVALSADLEARLLESRKRVVKQLSQRDASYSLLDKYKKSASFRN